MKSESKDTIKKSKPVSDTEGYETIMNSLAAGVCRLDREGAIIYVNESAASILGRTRPELIGQSYAEAFFGEGVTDTDPRCAPIEFTLVDGEISHVNTERFARPDGTDLLLEFMCVPVFGDGQPAGAVISFEDVTDRREVESAISKAREEALSAARSKAEFLANMSHEVRTPLTGIIGTVELLNSTDLDEVQKEYLRMLRSSTEFLHGIVNDILDFSKIEAGKFRSKKESFSLRAMASECLDSFRSTADAKSIAASVEVEESLPQFVVGDERLIKQVLNNLLSNALKFTDAGIVKLSIRTGEEEGALRFLVSDTGIGIAVEDRERLFAAFTQADSTDSREHKGTGLGLAISRRLVELLGGRIGIESEVGIGSEVWFEIPLPSAVEKPEKPAGPGVLFSEADKLSVLVVEDNPINLRVMQKMLERLGIASDKSVSGYEAVEACAAKEYDIVFMDCQMPGMDGFKAAEKIKRNAANPPAIVAFTASTVINEVTASGMEYMDGILRKPFTENDLIDVLNQNSGPSASVKTLDLVTDIREHSISQYVESATLERLSNLKTDDSRGFLTEILEVFAEHTSKRLVQLNEFAVAGDTVQTKRIAHNLKGSSANIGILRLSGLFEELENGSERAGKEELNELLHKIESEFAAVNSAIAELKNEDDPNEG